MKFFEIVPPGTRIPFVRSARYFIIASLLMIAASIGAMIYNSNVNGSVLNFGIDFAGGSSVRIALAADKQIPIEDLRTTLSARYEGASVVSVPDADNQVLVHVKDVASIDTAEANACKAVLADHPAKLRRFNYTEGASKIFMLFESQPLYSEIEAKMAAAGCEGKVDRGTGKLGEFPVELSLLGIGAKIQDDLNDAFGAGTVREIVSSETVGAKVGSQLKNDGIKSLLYAIGFIFLYVMLRFDLRYAPGGIVALAHDAALTVGAFALTYKEFNLQTIAALLTIIGYSINDTIVVFDRIRERIALHRDDPIEETVDVALNETLSRTILTSSTTLLVVIATWVLGTGPIKDFALFVGISVGTYSSLFIATPVFLWVNRRFYGGEGHLLAADEAAREGTGTLLGANNEEVDDLTGRVVGDLRADARAASEAAEKASVEAELGEATKTGGEATTSGEPVGEGEGKASRRRRRRPGA